jgi:hypothetical protein
MAKAVQSFEGYSMDYTSRTQYAVSESGKVFSRGQFRDPRYGYKWAAWRETSLSAVEGKSQQGPKNWRLPA